MSVGMIDGPDSEWLIQPGGVLTFQVDMEDIEREHPGFEKAVSNADKARFLLDTREGQMESDDIALPLVSSHKIAR